MNQTERLYKIDQLVRDRTVISAADLRRELEVSPATLKRDLEHLKARLNAPIEFDRTAGGYRYKEGGVGPRFQLPGLWFSADEVRALMTMHQMLESLGSGGLLGKQIKPLMDRLIATLGTDAGSAHEVIRRVRLIAPQRRPANVKWFELIGRAMLARLRLRIDYYTRYRNERSAREISPQRLVFHRNAWYLDAWCHKSEDIRMFALDAIESAEMTDTRARDVSLKQVDEAQASGYGIYRGKALQTALLRFTPEAARWVRAEIWHDHQQGSDLPDGGYELRVPYADPTELIMDILRHGENVKVIAPADLRRQVTKRLQTAAKRYAKPDGAA